MVTQEAQSAAAVLMVRPASFGFNPQTADSNRFAHAAAGPGADVQAAALREFDGLAAALRRAGVRVVEATDSAEPAKPDAVFPNNWLSFHADGTLVLYPMLAVNRRAERREDIIAQVVREAGFHVTRTVDLRGSESSGRYLEGTGSLVLDRAARTAYAALSARTDPRVLGEFARSLDYDLMTFEARDEHGRAVYHTNVLMAIGARFAVVCGECIDAARRAAVFARLESAHDIVDISFAQMRRFAGNILELQGAEGAVIALSNGAWEAFEPSQRRVLESHARPLAAGIPTIEKVGGGGVRCMLAEVHLPKHHPTSMS
jgi:hypothetical protein